MKQASAAPYSTENHRPLSTENDEDKSYRDAKKKRLGLEKVSNEYTVGMQFLFDALGDKVVCLCTRLISSFSR
jgi:hypothetical protein